jgi:hypothetical protein
MSLCKKFLDGVMASEAISSLEALALSFHNHHEDGWLIVPAISFWVQWGLRQQAY